MNKLLLKFYLKNNNSDKIKSLSDSEYKKAFNSFNQIDKIRLAHLRGDYKSLEEYFDNFSLMDNGRGLYEILNFKDNIIFYMELINYINTDIKDDNYDKRFNLPFWRNKLEESGYSSFMMNDVYSLICNNQDQFIDLLENDNHFRNLFFKNVSYEGNLYELKIDKIICEKKISEYLASQKEMKKFYNKKFSPVLYSINTSFFLRLPDEYKFLIGYHIKPKYGFNHKSQEDYLKKIKNVLLGYFSKFLSEKEIDDILSLYDTDVSSDMIASLISSIVKDHDYYYKYNFLLNNYFDGDPVQAISFGKKYSNTKLFNEICFKNILEIKDKIKFLSSASRLEGIDSLESVKSKTLDELKNTLNDETEFNDIKEDIRAFGNNDIVSLSYDREIAIIDKAGEFEEIEVIDSHDSILKKILLDKFSYMGKLGLMEMAKKLASEGIIVMIIEGDSVITVCPNRLSVIQKEVLKGKFEIMNSMSQIYIAYLNKLGDNLYVLNNDLGMNSEKAISELSRMRMEDNIKTHFK